MTTSSRWYAILVGFAALNVAGFGYAVGVAEGWHAAAHAVLAVGSWMWARRLRGGAREGELEGVRAALEDAESTLALQSSQIAELQERMDFAERVLAQARERKALD